MYLPFHPSVLLLDSNSHKAGTMLFEVETFDGSVVGPYPSQHLLSAFQNGKINLESRVKLHGHVAFKPLSMYFHLLWAQDEPSSTTPAGRSGSRAASDNLEPSSSLHAGGTAAVSGGGSSEQQQGAAEAVQEPEALPNGTAAGHSLSGASSDMGQTGELATHDTQTAAVEAQQEPQAPSQTAATSQEEYDAPQAMDVDEAAPSQEASQEEPHEGQGTSSDPI